MLIIDLLAHLSESHSPRGSRSPLNPLRGFKVMLRAAGGSLLGPILPPHQEELPDLGFRGWAMGPGHTGKSRAVPGQAERLPVFKAT